MDCNRIQGGVVKTTDKVASIQVTRGEGIDNIPTALFLHGSATENGGRQVFLSEWLRKVSSRYIQLFPKVR